MSKCSLLFAASTAILAASAAPAQNRPLQAPVARVILVGAHWCAPCRAELPELGTLAAAASPARIAVGWTDRKPVLAAALTGIIEVLPVMAAKDLVNRHGTAARGVPFAVGYGADGKVCTVWRGPLKAPDWPKLVQACEAD